MGGCSMLSCKSRSERKSAGVTFHLFPTDKKVREKWIKATGRQNWEPKKTSKICSLHFKKSCLIQSSVLTRLAPSAVPVKYIYDEDISGQTSTSQDSLATQKQEISIKRKKVNEESYFEESVDENISFTVYYLMASFFGVMQLIYLEIFVLQKRAIRAIYQMRPHES